MRLALLLSALAIAGLAAVAEASDAEMEEKKQAEIGLQPGMTLDESTAHLAEGLMPEEILELYEKGEYSSKVASWPNGIYKTDEEFQAASEENRKHLDVNGDGLMIDKRTGKYPDYVYGHPFPDIDPNDPKAATKIAWNVLYLIYSHLTGSPANRSDGFLGSDITQDDGPFFDGKPTELEWELVGEAEMYRLADPYSLNEELEMFQGVYNRKFPWKGELLQDYVPTGLKTAPYETEDGYTEYFRAGTVTYFSGLNFKQDRATNVNFGTAGSYLEQHVTYKDNFFDSQSLYRFGK